MSNANREDTPLRYRKLKSNGTVGSAEQTIEDMLGLPAGSVRVMNPSGRDARSDKLIGSLRKDWDAHYNQLAEQVKEAGRKHNADGTGRELEELPASGKWSADLVDRTVRGLEHIELASFALGYAPVKNVDGREGIIDLRDAIARRWTVRASPADSENTWTYGSIHELVEAGWVIE